MFAARSPSVALTASDQPRHSKARLFTQVAHVCARFDAHHFALITL